MKKQIAIIGILALMLISGCRITNLNIVTEEEMNEMNNSLLNESTNLSNNLNLSLLFPQFELNVTNCYAVFWNWNNSTNCKCTKILYNVSNCQKFIQMKYCLDDWEGWLKDDYFREQIYPYLKYDCDTGKEIDYFSNISSSKYISHSMRTWFCNEGAGGVAYRCIGVNDTEMIVWENGTKEIIT